MHLKIFPAIEIVFGTFYYIIRTRISASAGSDQLFAIVFCFLVLDFVLVTEEVHIILNSGSSGTLKMAATSSLTLASKSPKLLPTHTFLNSQNIPSKTHLGFNLILKPSSLRSFLPTYIPVTTYRSSSIRCLFTGIVEEMGTIKQSIQWF